ncbi:methyltransferase domain-containing protein [Alphaproteobacteria bacterium]|jgi:ubiquinone/menaquinone biosynthesis C-methylase UbiE|nr:methyltransferase domain-containing protein [Alphaproteobacteria bacterium]
MGDNVNISPLATQAAERYLETVRKSKDPSFFPVLFFCNLNLFSWHIKAFEEDHDPTNEFVERFNKASNLISAVFDSGISVASIEYKPKNTEPSANFESKVSNLFSDVWVDMTDDIYFDQSFEYTCERLEKNGIDPNELFRDKLVVDAGCGSGKFSATIAKLGAKKVVGVDIGEKGIKFARKQAKKKSYGEKIEYRVANLLELPFEANSVDMVWSNGVIHHTTNYEKCIQEFSRVTRPGGGLFLYVNGRFGLFELLQDTIRKSMEGVPREIFQLYLHTLGVNSGRLYWLMDCCFAPYEWKSEKEVISLLEGCGYGNIKKLKRGVEIDQIEKISTGLPFAKLKYGEGQLKFLCELMEDV